MPSTSMLAHHTTRSRTRRIRAQAARRRARGLSHATRRRPPHPRCRRADRRRWLRPAQRPSIRGTIPRPSIRGTIPRPKLRRRCSITRRPITRPITHRPITRRRHRCRHPQPHCHLQRAAPHRAVTWQQPWRPLTSRPQAIIPSPAHPLTTCRQSWRRHTACMHRSPQLCQGQAGQHPLPRPSTRHQPPHRPCRPRGAPPPTCRSPQPLPRQQRGPTPAVAARGYSRASGARRHHQCHRPPSHTIRRSATLLPTRNSHCHQRSRTLRRGQTLRQGYHRHPGLCPRIRRFLHHPRCPPPVCLSSPPSHRLLPLIRRRLPPAQCGPGSRTSTCTSSRDRAFGKWGIISPEQVPFQDMGGCERL